MTTTISQSEYNARMATFKAATKRSFDLNICHMVGPCAGGCIGEPGALRCPAISASPETLAAVQAEYDRALEAVTGVEVVPDEPAAPQQAPADNDNAGQPATTRTNVQNMRDIPCW